MVYIIRGEKNQGKTKMVLELFHHRTPASKPYGLASRKVFGDSGHIGYEGYLLTTGLTFPLAFNYEHVPSGWDEAYRLGPYSFSEKGFITAETAFSFRNISDKNPLFLDEVGPLELSEKGFFPIIRTIINLDKDIYITSRPACVIPIIEEFAIKDYTVIEARIC